MPDMEDLRKVRISCVQHAGLCNCFVLGGAEMR